MGLLGRLLPSP